MKDEIIIEKNFNIAEIEVEEKVLKPKLEKLEITPSQEDQHFESIRSGYNDIIVHAVSAAIDENIQSENIKAGTTILGVNGKETIIDTEDATATAENILEGQTAYVNGEKIDGGIETYDGSYEGNAEDNELVIADARYFFYKECRVDMIDKLTIKPTNAAYMFQYCKTKTINDILPKIDTSQCLNMQSMFASLQDENKVQLDLSTLDTSSVKYTNNMFYGYDGTELDLSGCDFGNVEFLASPFTLCGKLENLKSFKNLGKGYTMKIANYSSYECKISYCTNLTIESLIDLITNGLYDLSLTYDVANGGKLYRQDLVLAAESKAKLESTEKGLQAMALANAKGWDIVVG